jgi:RimJ/RimL family protein N-acetyltransferase
MSLPDNQHTYILQTERLKLRQFTLDDTDFIIDLLNSPGWLQYIGNRNVKTEEQAINYLKNGPIKSYNQNGFGLSMVVTNDGNPIGMCGIIKRDNLEHPDIGFAFLPEHTGHGYAFEIAEATLDYAKHHLNFSTVLAITLPGNSKSIRLLEKIGLRLVKSFRPQNENEDLLLYSN